MGAGVLLCLKRKSPFPNPGKGHVLTEVPGGSKFISYELVIT